MRGVLRRNPQKAGSKRGRTCLRRIRQIPAMPTPLTSFGRNGSGRTRLRASGSTRKFARIRRSMTPRMTGILIVRLLVSVDELLSTINYSAAAKKVHDLSAHPRAWSSPFAGWQDRRNMTTAGLDLAQFNDNAQFEVQHGDVKGG